MQSLLSSPVQCALPHALPFRVILEEHRRRREADLLANAAAVFAAMKEPPPGKDTEAKLLHAVLSQEAAYRELARVDSGLAMGSGTEARLDVCLEECKRQDAPLKALLHRMESSALCFSGGGIRSASFCLGVMEGLADFSFKTHTEVVPEEDDTDRLMQGLDYLSTVSGGGYIGSWLMAWIYRRQNVSPAWKKAYGEVIGALAGRANVTGGDPEPQPVRHLRSYTSYLAPALGLTLDTFTLVAIVTRNLLANWLMLVPLLIGLIALVRCSGGLMLKADPSLSAPSYPGAIFFSSYPQAAGATLLVLFFIAALAAAFGLPSHSGMRRKVFAFLSGVWPSLIFLCAVASGSWLLTARLRIHHYGSLTDTNSATIFLIALVGYLCLSVSVWFAFKARVLGSASKRGAAKPAGKKGLLFWAFVWIVVAGAVASAAAAGLFHVLSAYVFPALADASPSFQWAKVGASQADPFPHALFVIFGVPLTILVLLASTSLFCALVGNFEMEEDREWWARGGGWLLSVILLWIVAHAVAFYGAVAMAGVYGLIVGVASSLVGYSGVTSAGPRPVKSAQLGKIGSFLSRHSLVLPVVGGVAVLLIAMGAAAAEEALRLRVLPLAGDMHGVPRTVVILLAAAGLTVIVNLAININLFSLGGMYRMRLMRAYLGASNVLRQADAFTHFDPFDTPYESELPGGEGVPLHVVNTTLNLVGTKNLAWRQRKGESFTFNPVVSGGWRVGYVPTECYGGSRGVTLATAMAISGAAANPNMGYHSSPLLSLLMTFFNLRLGSWLPNPKQAGEGDSAKKFLRRAGPTFALHPLVEEALGQTDDTNRWIELTDGGHFENLGIYEMVLRRCKHIVVVDAGADPDCQFEDLGNAIRKIRIDLGVPLVFGPEMKMMKGPNPDNSYCAVATIYYKYVDEQETNGTLIYIKAGLTGKEPVDILQYASSHPTFPHETTADQFFNESQFESYRHLGFHIASVIAKNRQGTDTSMKGFCAAARKLWASRPPVSTFPGDVVAKAADSAAPLQWTHPDPPSEAV